MSASPQIFISHSHKDAIAVATLVRALERAGVEVWIDRNAIDAAADIQSRIENGLAACSALLAWFSADYPHTRAGQWEITAALLAAHGDSGPGQRVIVVNPAADRADVSHLQPPAVRQLPRFPAPALDDTAGFDLLAHRIAAAVAPLPGPLGALRQFARPPSHGCEPLGAQRFVGRIGELWQIHDALVRGDRAIVAGQPAPHATGQPQGSGGSGKSALAAEYALRFGSCWPGGIYWLRAQAYGSQLAGFAADLGLDPQKLDDAQLRRELGRRLDQAGQPYLWIVDDLPECPRAELDTWLAPGASGRTLATSRARQQDGAGLLLPLAPLPRAAAHALLTRGDPPHPDETDAVAGILNRIDGHPLALDLARAACQRQGYASFHLRLEVPSQDALELTARLAGELPNGHSHGIATTLLAALAELPEAGMDFLRLAAQLADAPIAHELVAACFAGVDQLEAQAAAQRAELGMRQAIERALAAHLCTGKAGGRASVPGLVGRSLRLRDSDRARQSALRQAAVAALNDQLGAGTERPPPGLLEHAARLAATAATADELRLAAQLGRHARAATRYPAARRWLETALDGQRGLLGAEHPHTLATMSELAETMRAQGDLDGALRLQKSVLATRRRELGEAHADTLGALDSLAATLWAQGDLAGAVALEKSALEIRSRVLGEAHPDTLGAMSNLADSLKAQGDLDGALELQQSMLALCRRARGEAHPDTLGAMNSLAATCKARGDLDGALALQQSVLALRRRELGEEHPATLAAMNNLALTRKARGDLDGALALQKSALALRRRMLGKTHPDTLNAMSSLAGTLWAQGDLDGALELQKSVLAIRHRELGATHPATIVSAWNLFHTQLQLDDRASAEALRQTYLLPLLTADPATLDPDLTTIRDRLQGMQPAAKDTRTPSG